MVNPHHVGKVLLCLDLSYQTYRAAAAHPMLTSRRIFTGGLYGFLTTFAKMVRETKATHVAFCQDRKPYLRSIAYPDYKQLRKKNADDDLLKAYTQSMTLVLETLDVAGFPIWGVNGFESDDLIAHAAVKYRHRFDTIYAASNDSDLYQLLWIPNFSIYTKDILTLVDRQSMWEKHGLTPDQFMYMTAMTGTHNDIEGIPRCGPVTATKAIKDPALLRNFRSIYGGVIDRNLGLIKLPHAELPRTTKIPEYRGGFNERNLYRSLAAYDIDVTASMSRAFEQLQPR